MESKSWETRKYNGRNELIGVKTITRTAEILRKQTICEEKDAVITRYTISLGNGKKHLKNVYAKVVDYKGDRHITVSRYTVKDNGVCGRILTQKELYFIQTFLFNSTKEKETSNENRD